MFDPYKLIAGIVIFVGLIGGSVWYGYNWAEDTYKAQIIKLEADVKAKQGELEASLSDVKINTLTKYVDRIQTVKEKVYVTKTVIKYVPSKCELSNGWVSVHNASATGGNADPTAASDGTSSGIKDVEALDTIVDNYGTCHANAERLNALQEWIRNALVEVEKSNKEAKNK